MWKLTFFLITLLFFYLLSKKEVVLILNDCDHWERYNDPNYALRFSYDRLPYEFPFISMGHRWIDEDYKLSTQSMTFSQIMESDPIYTSRLNHHDWRKLARENERVFILIPEDYCSEKRFLHDYKFTLYEVRVHVTASADDVVGNPKKLFPLPELDSIRRKKKN